MYVFVLTVNIVVPSKFLIKLIIVVVVWGHVSYFVVLVQHRSVELCHL